jgi:hypothetical protein
MLNHEPSTNFLSFHWTYPVFLSYIFYFFFQDETIYIQRNWILDSERKIIPRNLHVQFHGREMHSLCFVSENLQVRANGKHDIFSRSSWIATGCEDGTVRLTRYDDAHFIFRL